jgi:hypothetical protein
LLHHPIANNVRLRLARRADAAGVRALAEGAGAETDAWRLVCADPRERAVICAVTVSAAGEAVVGFGSIRLRAGAEPDLVLAGDPRVAEALHDALVERHAARPRPKAPRAERALRAVARRARRPD